MMAAAFASLGVVLALTADFIYAKVNSAPPQARPIKAVNNLVRIPVAEVQDGNLHLFTLITDGQSIRFMVIKKPNGYGTALDACLDLRRGRLPTGRTERDLPALRFRHLYSVDRAKRRMQSHRVSFAD